MEPGVRDMVSLMPWRKDAKKMKSWKLNEERGQAFSFADLGRFETKEQEALGLRDTTCLSQFPQKSVARVGFESLLIRGSAVTLIFSGSYQQNLH